MNINEERFIHASLENHLFFLRIIKEHLYLIVSALPQKNSDLILEAKQLNTLFNNLLIKAVNFAKGIIEIKPFMVTRYTLEAEKLTEFYTGLPIDNSVTTTELALGSGLLRHQELSVQTISSLNNEVLKATQSMITFNSKLIEDVSTCQLFTHLYPLQLDHIRREQIYFYNILSRLQSRSDEQLIPNIVGKDIFWDDIMSEHAEFIRGLLDPTEELLISKANDYSIRFDKLKRETKLTNNISMLNKITYDSIQLMKEYIDFKENGVSGALQCKIKSIILPILADHVLREALYYLYLLEDVK